MKVRPNRSANTEPQLQEAASPQGCTARQGLEGGRGQGTQQPDFRGDFTCQAQQHTRRLLTQGRCLMRRTARPPSF
jgi:hypothetical protein